MGFKLLYTQLSGPQGNFLVSNTLDAQAGQVGAIQGTSAGDPEVVLASSGTTGMVGIIDENKTATFTAAVVNEVVVSGQTTVANANLIESSYVSASGTTSVLSAVNGTITNTITNDQNDQVSYHYTIPGKAGDDTTLGSGKATLWIAEGEYATDIYELSSTATVASYAVNAPLYIADDTNSQQGRLTADSSGAIVVGYVTKAPTAGNPYMHFFKINGSI